jgi:hypothetical protein
MEVQSNFFIYGKPTILAHLTSSFSNVQMLPWVHPRKIILFNSTMVGGFSNSLIFHHFPIKVVLSNLCFINSIARGNSKVLLMNLYSLASLISPILLHQVLFSIPFTPNKPYFSKLMCYILPFFSQKNQFKKNKFQQTCVLSFLLIFSFFSFFFLLFYSIMLFFFQGGFVLSLLFFFSIFFLLNFFSNDYYFSLFSPWRMWSSRWFSFA